MPLRTVRKYKETKNHKAPNKQTNKQKEENQKQNKKNVQGEITALGMQ